MVSTHFPPPRTPPPSKHTNKFSYVPANPRFQGRLTVEECAICPLVLHERGTGQLCEEGHPLHGIAQDHAVQPGHPAVRHLQEPNPLAVTSANLLRRVHQSQDLVANVGFVIRYSLENVEYSLPSPRYTPLSECSVGGRVTVRHQLEPQPLGHGFRQPV